MIKIVPQRVYFLISALVILSIFFVDLPQLDGFPVSFGRPTVARAAIVASSSIIVAWPYASSSIPNGWHRDTALDGYFLKMVPNAATTPGNTGGAETHTHTSPAHNHTQDSHAHGATTTPASTGGTGTGASTGSNNGALSTHTHTIGASNGSVATNNATAATVGSGSSLPPYREVIWITSDGTHAIPNGAIMYTASSTVPSGWVATTTGSLFFRGAGTGLDPSSTILGATTSTHTSNHTHTQNSHTHTSPVNTGAAAGTSAAGTTGPTCCAAGTHTHSVSWSSDTATNQSSDGNVNSADIRPPYLALTPIENTSGGYLMATGSIAVWRGNIEDIPEDWYIADGTNGTPDLRDRFIVSTTTAGIAEIGGSAGHSHTASSHTHTQDPHFHTFTLGNPSGTTKTGNSTTVYSDTTHSHTVFSASTVATNQSATITIDNTADTRPPYYEVAFIVYMPPTLTQSGFRIFDNTDSTDVGSPMEAFNATATLASTGSAFRARILLHTDLSSTTPRHSFKLEYAGMGAGTCGSPLGTPSTYTPVTGSTLIAFLDNATPGNGSTLTANAGDPTHGAHAVVNQSYVETNPFSPIATTSPGQDAMWDFSLVDNGAAQEETYCLRISRDDGTPVAVDNYAAIVTAAAAANPEVLHYRWRTTNGNEVGASSFDEDTPLTTAYLGDRYRLRVLISANSDINNFSYQLEYASSTCTDWHKVPADALLGEDWELGLSQYFIDLYQTTNVAGLLSDPPGKSFVSGYVLTQSNPAPSFSLTSSQFTEFSYVVQSTSNALKEVPYCFRLTNNGDASNFTYSVIPGITLTSQQRPQAGGFVVEPSGTGIQRTGGGQGAGQGAEQSGSGSQQYGGSQGGGNWGLE